MMRLTIGALKEILHNSTAVLRQRAQDEIVRRIKLNLKLKQRSEYEKTYSKSMDKKSK